MDKSINFMEFVIKNPPPCMPGTKLYWFDEETGDIRLDEHGIESIVLDSDWIWKIIDPDNGEIVTPNENQFFCITKNTAQQAFRLYLYGVRRVTPVQLLVMLDAGFRVLRVDVLIELSTQCYRHYLYAPTDAEDRYLSVSSQAGYQQLLPVAPMVDATQFLHRLFAKEKRIDVASTRQQQAVNTVEST